MFKNASLIEINHYKNVFDKNTLWMGEKKSIIIAKLTSPAITKAPAWYGHTPHAYFFKTSLGCVYDCDYCFLKGAFKTEHMVFFVNYDDIKKQIEETIKKSQNPPLSVHSSAPLSKGGDVTQWSGGIGSKEKELWFYSSDYSDIQGMDAISGFNTSFIQYFEQFQWVNMEVRTKSGNITSLLELWFVPKNTEIAFSLNPSELIDRYETWTASLTKRFEAINTLLEKWFRVGIRLLPLLPVKNYKEIYSRFFRELQENLDIGKLDSSFASWLLYTKEDYKVMLKKYPSLDILHYLDLESDNFYRESREVRDWFYKEIKQLDKKCLLCLEN